MLEWVWCTQLDWYFPSKLLAHGIQRKICALNPNDNVLIIMINWRARHYQGYSIEISLRFFIYLLAEIERSERDNLSGVVTQRGFRYIYLFICLWGT